mmetsp:Transcript_91948/g.256170  ORF Transcript_91948/g.256170 Transcript_91948/m.256170 type:complete len:216 (+) Transcript_91948:604-1251(+)
MADPRPQVHVRHGQHCLIDDGAHPPWGEPARVIRSLLTRREAAEEVLRPRVLHHEEHVAPRVEDPREPHDVRVAPLRRGELHHDLDGALQALHVRNGRHVGLGHCLDHLPCALGTVFARRLREQVHRSTSARAQAVTQSPAEQLLRDAGGKVAVEARDRAFADPLAEVLPSSRMNEGLELAFLLLHSLPPLQVVFEIAGIMASPVQHHTDVQREA